MTATPRRVQKSLCVSIVSARLAFRQAQRQTLSDLAVETIQVVPADALDTATDGHGMTELAGSCFDCVDCSCGNSCYVPADTEEV